MKSRLLTFATNSNQKEESKEKQDFMETLKDEWIKDFDSLNDNHERNGFFMIGFVSSVIEKFSGNIKLKDKPDQWVSVEEIIDLITAYQIDSSLDCNETKEEFPRLFNSRRVDVERWINLQAITPPIKKDGV